MGMCTDMCTDLEQALATPCWKALVRDGSNVDRLFYTVALERQGRFIESRILFVSLLGRSEGNTGHPPLSNERDRRLHDVLVAYRYVHGQTCV